MTSLVKKVILLSCFLLLTACIKNNFNQQNTLVPDVRVDTSVPLNYVSFPGDYTIKYGVGAQGLGIIVFNIDGTNFLAYDLSCPYLSPSDCNIAMSVDSAGEMSCAGCANDDITFMNITKTRVVINETAYHLREYYAFLEGGVVRITNY